MPVALIVFELYIFMNYFKTGSSERNVTPPVQCACPKLESQPCHILQNLHLGAPLYPHICRVNQKWSAAS